MQSQLVAYPYVCLKARRADLGPFCVCCSSVGTVVGVTAWWAIALFLYSSVDPVSLPPPRSSFPTRASSWPSLLHPPRLLLQGTYLIWGSIYHLVVYSHDLFPKSDYLTFIPAYTRACAHTHVFDSHRRV